MLRPVLCRSCIVSSGRSNLSEKSRVLSHASGSAIRYKSTSTRSRSVSFAFDIDGVLLKSSKPVEGATAALELLKKHRIPFILLTNGGGLSESKRVANLTRHLSTEILPSQFIQSHTPFQSHAARHGYKNVLVCGGHLDTCRHVALDYGFPHVTIPFDILATDAAIWPYHTLSHSEAAVVQPLSRDAIDAIYVFHDPLDWGLDSQIIMDVLLREGDRRGKTQQVPIYFSNPDLLWANAYQFSRFGQGAFRILVEGLFSAVTGSALKSTTIGKPSRVTYEYADTILRHLRKSMTQLPEGNGEGTVYMVGDNKLSDIQGANAFGWQSILVKTGVFEGTTEEGLTGEIPARYCVTDVKAAVDMVLSQAGII